jgi:transcriptional regulator with GAF, ATPase, and Fis domain
MIILLNMTAYERQGRSRVLGGINERKRGEAMIVDENEFFRQATLRISSSLIAEIAMKRCMDFLTQHIPASGMLFGLYDPDLNIGKVLASIWPPNFQKLDETYSFPTEFWNWMKEKWAREPGITIINDLDKEELPVQQTISMIWSADTSHLLMDLELEKRRLGVLALFAEGKHRYNDLHAHLISLLHEPFATAISNILQHQEIQRLKDMLADDNRYLHQEILRMTGDTIIGANFGLRDVMKMVRQVAPLDNPVLLMGETGVGKEVFANAIHFSSLRRTKPYITINCGAIPENLIDSELFGHEKGAFTGAIARKRGRFERADTGTIFLDEIGELPPAAQVRLLRVLQQREIERVGGSESIPVDVRVISATHRNLEEMVRSGQFREDLWFRLNVFPIVIPPLRRRIEDIPALVNHFVERKSRELKIQNLPHLAPGAMDQLQTYDWPGNVRELENLVERALIQSQLPDNDGLLRFGTPSPSSVFMKSKADQKQDDVIRPLDEIIAAYIEQALDHSGGKVEGQNGTAQMLRIHPSTLRGRMRKLGISHGRKRQANRISRK